MAAKEQDLRVEHHQDDVKHADAEDLTDSENDFEENDHEEPDSVNDPGTKTTRLVANVTPSDGDAPVRRAMSAAEANLRKNPLAENAADVKTSSSVQTKQKPLGRRLLDDTDDEKPAEANQEEDENVNVPVPDVTGKLMKIHPSETTNLGDGKNWRRAVDRRDGRVYYWHIETREISFLKPAGFVEPERPKHLRRVSGEKRLPGHSRQGSTDSAKSSHSRHSSDELVEKDESNRMPRTRNERRLMMLRGTSMDMTKDFPKLQRTVSDEKDDSDKEENKDAPEQKSHRRTASAVEEEAEVEIKDGVIEFTFAKHRSGILQNIFHIGRINDSSVMLSYSKHRIHKSLLKENRKHDVICVQAFKNVMSYMGDRISIKNDVSHAKKLIGYGIKGTEQIRDEILLQVCKQVTKHPKESHAVKGWELLLLLLGCFQPSKSMRSYIETLCDHVIKEDSTSVLIKNLARTCLDHIPKITQMGVRREVPSNNEIKHHQQGAPLALKVYTLDHNIKSIQADPFMRVMDVQQIIAQKYGVQYPKMFAIFEVSYLGNERVLEDKIRILDVISRWERLIAENDIKISEPFKLVFKAEMVLKTNHKRISEDQETQKLLYYQAVHDFTTERYPFDTKLISSVMSLYLQGTFGDIDSDPSRTQEWIEKKISEVVPAGSLAYFNNKKSQAVKMLAQKVTIKYTRLKGLSQQEAQTGFMDYIEEWPLYGALIVTGVPCAVPRESPRNLAPVIWVAVSYNGVSFVHPKTRNILESYTFEEVITFGHSANRFIVQCGDLVTQKRFTIKTQFGGSLIRQMQLYISEKQEELAELQKLSQA